MAGNCKPANVGPEATWVVNQAVLNKAGMNIQLGFFDGVDGGSYEGTYFYDANDFLDITFNEECNIWATPHCSNYLGYNAQLAMLKWDAGKWVNTGINENVRTTVQKEWTKIFTNVPAGRYKFYCPTAQRIEGEWYLESTKPVVTPTVPGKPLNLTATAGNAQAVLNWSSVTGATGYNVKRSTTAGGPYTTISSNVQGAIYTDTGLTNGTTYYYVVTAVNASGESGSSNEAAATPVAPVVGQSILRVTMLDSSEREYKVTEAEVAAFIQWFNRNNMPVQNTCYSFAKPINGSKEYLAFDKIISFKKMVHGAQLVLAITMTDSSEREYKVSAAEYDAFVQWYNVAVNANGNMCYEFTDAVDGMKEYLSFGKIISFEVIPVK